MLKYIKKNKKGCVFIKGFKKIMIVLATLAVSIPIITFSHFYIKINSIFDKTNNVEANSSTQNLMINDAIISDNITNVLLIGTDARSTSEQGRSDTMIIATIDEKHKSIKLTSLARDTYVDIPGYGEQKLNHSYSYGGSDLLIKTIEHNFYIDISNYVIVDFNSFSSIIDALGGVTVEVKEGEISELNKYIPECFEASSNKKNKKMILIEKPGMQKLNGYQALSYSRIRKNDNAIERNNRQRKVLQSLLNEASSLNIFEIPKVLNAILPYVKTNMDFNDILNYSKKVLKMGNFNINQLQFPIQEYSEDKKLGTKGWVTTFNKDKCLPLLHEFIFEDEEFLKENKVYNSYLNNLSNEDLSNKDFGNNDSLSENDSKEDSLLEPTKPEDYFNDEYYDKDLNVLEELENIDTEDIPYF